MGRNPYIFGCSKTPRRWAPLLPARACSTRVEVSRASSLAPDSGDHACCRGGQIATPTMAAAVFAVGAAKISNRCFSALRAGPRTS